MTSNRKIAAEIRCPFGGAGIGFVRLRGRFVVAQVLRDLGGMRRLVMATAAHSHPYEYA